MNPASSKLSKALKALKNSATSEHHAFKCFGGSCITSHYPECLAVMAGKEKTTLKRVFDLNFFSGAYRPDEIEVPFRCWTYLACNCVDDRCPKCGQPPFLRGCVIAAIAGVCVNTGRPANESEHGPSPAIGVYFGMGNDFNESKVVLDTRNTSQAAILKACIETLSRFFAMWVAQYDRKNALGFPFHTCIIKTDSEYLVNGITEWLPKWEKNGWKNCKGQPVANEELWREIDEHIRYLAPIAWVRFYLVPQEHNMLPTAMAWSALSDAT